MFFQAWVTEQFLEITRDWFNPYYTHVLGIGFEMLMEDYCAEVLWC